MKPEADTVVYVTREIERALGMEPGESYRIVSNKTRYGQSVKDKYPEYVTLIEAFGPDKKPDLLGTTDLLARPETKALISNLKSQISNNAPSILVFKNTSRVEASAKTLNCVLLNPPAALSERVENKITQLRWLGQTGTKYLPPHGAKVTKTITWKGENPFILQWNHGHTGDGTLFIKTLDDLRAIQEKFPERIARISAYVAGPSFTVNAVVTPSKILIGNISYQITGMQPFTDGQFSTVGNDWSLAKKLLSAEDIKAIEAMANEIGSKLQSDGWKGLFGIDLVKSDKNGRIYLIEVNARQPASTTFESSLQEKAREKGARGLTTFEAHMRALCSQPIDQEIIPIEGGAQIVQRVTKHIQDIFDDLPASLSKLGYTVVAYQNMDYNSDLLRVQSDQGVMETHGSFNAKGHEIAEAIKGAHFNLAV